jgi:ParB family chromosome partitioning protein
MRKNLLASIAAQETVPNVNPTTHEYTRHGASRSMLISLEEMADNAKKMFVGETIVEIDPALIDPSFAQDRMAAFEPEGADAGFVTAIKEQGQLVPILLRKHPDVDGRYQPAY